MISLISASFGAVWCLFFYCFGREMHDFVDLGDFGREMHDLVVLGVVVCDFVILRFRDFVILRFCDFAIS